MKIDSKNKKVIFCNGIFDLMHIGHIRLLKWAKKQGGALMVSIDSDKWAEKIKRKPVYSQSERYAIISELKCVDCVVIHDSNEDLIKHILLLRPDYIVKGPDYKDKKIVGEDFCKTLIYKGTKNVSTTEIIEKIQNETKK